MKKILETIKRDWSVYLGYAVFAMALIINVCTKNIDGALFNVCNLLLLSCIHVLLKLVRLLYETIAGWDAAIKAQADTACKLAASEVRCSELDVECLSLSMKISELKTKLENRKQKRNNTKKKECQE